jgi:prepilin-type N-terminal cleavage/methylation domain-containing protein
MVVKSFQHKQNGFTLVELLIVVAIMGVLSAAVLPNLTKYVGNGIVGAANTELSTVKNSISDFMVDNSGLLPCAIQPTIGDPQPLVETSILPYVAGAGIKGGYLVDDKGSVSGDPANAYPGLNWDAISGRWVK